MNTDPRRHVDGVCLSLWRAVAFFRVITLLVALFLIIRWRPIYARPGVALGVGAAMLAVTAVVGFLAISGRAHRPVLVLGDLVVTAGLTLLSIAAQTAGQRHGGMVTLTTIWAAGPTIEAALLAGIPGGVGAAALQFAASAVVAQTWQARTLYSGVLLLVVGAVAGLVATYTARAETELRAAATAQAALAERERLARSIHDGVLQVLGLVHRTGRDAGGQWGLLAAEAAEQEIALRGLITSSPDATAPGRGDLAEQLRSLGSARVSVSTPAGAMPVDAGVAAEVTDAVRAAVQNVAVHAGDGAHAWVLLEHLGDAVQVTIRDDGAGIAPGRLDTAEREGRIGVARSVRGRIADLGGHCSITSAPGEGTQIELSVPVR